MRSLLLTLVLVACTPPEKATQEAGGKPPIICIRSESRLLFCRDARGVVYACTNDESSDCLSTLQTGFNVRLMPMEREP